MKTKIFFLLIFMSFMSQAQEADTLARDIPLKVVNKRGRPIRRVVASSPRDAQAGMTDNAGQFIFRGMTDSDTIFVMLSGIGETIIPVSGLDSIMVIQRSSRRYSYMDNDGQSVMIDRVAIDPSSLIDVPTLLKQRHCNSLVELLRGYVPGLQISPNNTANIRGAMSINLSTEPLVLIDGIMVGTLNEANDLLNVNDIQTIEILKHAPEYGVRGGNGAIRIVTKK